ncbi:MAG: adenylate/guanylate cyclase domain-containing protein [Acidimicrobiales bacterium]
MKSAPELVAFAERWLTSWFVDWHDFDDALARHPGIRFIGPDPDEWWEGYEKLAAVGRAQFSEMRELGGVTVDPDEIVAWKEGTVGWISFRGRLSIGELEPQECRSTIIVHEDGAFWKVVHFQLAFTITNEEAVGLELTTAVDELLLLVQDEAPSAAGMAADGSVTIVFTDLEGSTVLLESLGEDRWLGLLDWHRLIVTQQTAVFGGVVVKGQGDGFMLAFPAAGSAVACAIGLQQSFSNGWNGVPVLARIGIHTGNAKSEAGDFFGRTVVVAARVSSNAAGGEVLLTVATQEKLGGAFDLEGPRTLSLKGMGGAHTVFALGWK